MAITITATYVISMLIFVFLPFLIYISFSIYFCKKMVRVSDHYERTRQSKRLSKECKQIILHSILYIFFNLSDFVISLYSCIKYSNQLDDLDLQNGKKIGWVYWCVFTFVISRGSPNHFHIFSNFIFELPLYFLDSILYFDSFDKAQSW